MNKILIMLIVLAIVVIIIVIARIVIKRKNMKNILGLNEDVQKKIEEINHLDEEIEDALKRMISICKTEEALELLDIWKKEYYEQADKIVDLKDLYEKMQTELVEQAPSKYLKINESFNDKYKTSIEDINEIHNKLLTYTNYEMKNTEIALELKEKIKDFKREIDIQLNSSEKQDQLGLLLNKLTEELSNFEQKQKIGKYKEARDVLKGANEELANLIIIFDFVTELQEGKRAIEADINATKEAKIEIEKIGYKLQIDEELEGLEQIEEYKEKLVKYIEEINFSTTALESFDEKKSELEMNRSYLDNIKNVLLVEYQKIKDLIDAKESVEKVRIECEELINASSQEYETIKVLYDLNEINKISTLSEEIENFQTFEGDYEKLLVLIQDSKDNYSILVEKLQQSEQYLYKIMDKVKHILFQIKEIREDEIMVRSLIEDNKKQITQIVLYLKHYEHFYEMSTNLSVSIEECYKKMNLLEEELDKTPLNIEEVRKNNRTIETLKEDLIRSTHEEIKRKNAINKLITHANQFVVDDEVETLMLHVNYLYNNRDYAAALKELRKLISTYSSEDIYKKIVSKIEISSFNDYVQEVF